MEANDAASRRTGILAALGGASNLALALIMVTITYMTGWAIIPDIAPAERPCREGVQPCALAVGQLAPPPGGVQFMGGGMGRQPPCLLWARNHW